MQSTNKINVLIVGAHGHLGSCVLKHCLSQPSLCVSAMDRHMNQDKKCCDEVTKQGGQCCTGDITDKNSIRDCTKGMHTVISCIEGDAKVIYDGQMNLLEDCERNGVKRFVPASYTVHFEEVTKEDEPLLFYRKRFMEELNKTSVKGLFIHVGLFMDTYFTLCKDGLCYWGDKTQKLDLISCNDAAMFIAEAVAQPDRTGDLCVTGTQLSPAEIQEIYKKVKGKDIELKSCGDVSDLKKKALEMQNKGDLHEAAKYFYALHAFDGKGKHDSTQNNEFPNVKPMSLEDYIKTNPENVTF